VITTSLSWSEISARRLVRSALSTPSPDARPADVAGAMCGAYAQVLSAAELSIGLRLATGTRRDVRDALWADRSLVKTFGPRGTVHLLPTHDLPMWTGALSAVPSSYGQATELFDSLAGELEQVEAEGAAGWVAAGDTAVPAAAPQGVRLLPYFDAYTVACQPRDLLFAGRAAERALAGGQAGTFPVLLVDGMVAGVWHQRRSGRKLAVTVEPLGRLTAAQRGELDDQVARVGSIVGAEPELAIGTVTVGAHA
jgi:hypothetical protein